MQYNPTNEKGVGLFTHKPGLFTRFVSKKDFRKRRPFYLLKVGTSVNKKTDSLMEATLCGSPLCNVII